jgi:hypothetical protein
MAFQEEGTHQPAEIGLPHTVRPLRAKSAFFCIAEFIGEYFSMFRRVRPTPDESVHAQNTGRGGVQRRAELSFGLASVKRSWEIVLDI